MLINLTTPNRTRYLPVFNASDDKGDGKTDDQIIDDHTASDGRTLNFPTA